MDFEAFLDQDTVPASVVRELAAENERLTAELDTLFALADADTLERWLIRRFGTEWSAIWVDAKYGWSVLIHPTALGHDPDKANAIRKAIRRWQGEHQTD